MSSPGALLWHGAGSCRTLGGLCGLYVHFGFENHRLEGRGKLCVTVYVTVVSTDGEGDELVVTLWVLEKYLMLENF